MFLLYEADITAVGYVCLRKISATGEKLLNLFNSCYHMIESSSDLSLSIFDDINMETAHDNNGSYSVVVQFIDRSKTSTFRDICIYPERNIILCDC